MGKVGGELGTAELLFLASPRARCPFPRVGSPAGSLVGGSSLKGLIRPWVEKQSQAPKERGQVEKHVWSPEGDCILQQVYAGLSPAKQKNE